jgi:hypothetical protein
VTVPLPVSFNPYRGGDLRDGVKAGECAGGVVRELIWIWAIVWGGQAGVVFFDDLGRGSGVAAFGEFFCGEEFGVAVVAVARAEEVEEALLADGDVGGSG